jgi:hypothetical protein
MYHSTRPTQEMAPEDRAFIFVGLFLIVGLPLLIWLFLRPAVPVVRHEVVAVTPDGCKAEVWVSGKEGDSLIRLMHPQKYGRPIFMGVALIHKNLTSSRVAIEVNTPEGRCGIVRWNLLVNGQQTDSLKRGR